MKDEMQPKAEMNSYEQRKEIYRRLIRSLRLIDDAFMNCVFDGNIEGTTLLLRIILGKSSLAVLEVNTQETLHNLQGRSRRLDILARDGEGTYYNIEVQRENAGAAFIRADEHSSLLMAKTHAPSCEPQDVPERWVIFITENDVIGLGLPLYPIERKLTVGDGRVIDDKEHMLYVNGAYKKKTTAIGRLMHDFFCEEPDDMHYTTLAKRARFFKKDKKGVEIMCRQFEEVMAMGKAEGRVEGKAEGKAEGRAEGKAEGRAEGKAEEKERSILSVLNNGVSEEETARLLNLAIEEVRQATARQKAASASL